MNLLADESVDRQMTQHRFPPGWDEERVRNVLAHYGEQSEDEAVAEDEAAFEDSTQDGDGGATRTCACHSGADCEARSIELNRSVTLHEIESKTPYESDDFP